MPPPSGPPDDRGGPRYVPGLPSTAGLGPDARSGSSKVAESVTERLQRLRIESLRHDRNTHQASHPNPWKAVPPHLGPRRSAATPATGANAIPVDVAVETSWLSTTRHGPAGSDRGASVRPNRWTRGGHAVPQSWQPPKAEGVPLDLSRSIPAENLTSLSLGAPDAPLYPDLVARRRILFPPSGPSSSRLSQTSLMDACFRKIGLDLALPVPETASAVQESPPRWKERLSQVAAEWSPLSERGVSALLGRPPPGPPDGTLSPNDLLRVSIKDEGNPGWDEDDSPDELVSVDLSFSVISLSTLRRLLLQSSSEPSPFLCSSEPRPPTPPSLLHPNLTSLSISGCPHLAISPSLLSLLSHLPLRALNLCYMSTTVGSDLALSKLANATGRLESVDVSFNPSWVGLKQLRDFDWVNKWRRLERLGIRGNVRLIGEEGDVTWALARTGEAEKKEDRQWRLTTVRDCLAERRKAGGVWIDIVI